MGLRAEVAKAIFVRQNVTSSYDVGEFWDQTSNAESFKMRAFYDADAALSVITETVLREVDRLIESGEDDVFALRSRLREVLDVGPTTPLLR